MPYRVEIAFPPGFVRFNSVQPDPKFGADGWWYFVVYGHAEGVAESRQHLFRWKPGETAALVPLPGETNARGSIGVHSAGAAMFSWEGSGSFPRLVAQEIVGFVPAPLDSRVDALAGGVELPARYVAALERLCALLEL